MTILNDYSLLFNSNLKFNFSGGNLTSDSGLLLIKEFLQMLNFPNLLKKHFTLDNSSNRRIHSHVDLVTQQLFQIIAGYHTDIHANELTTEPFFTTLLNKPSLASQPTLSRHDNALTEETVAQFTHLNQAVLELFYLISPPEQFIFDIDSTNFQTFGNQEGHAFNGHYKELGYHPVMVFDGMTGDCISAALRPGNVYTSKDAFSHLKPTLHYYNETFGDLPRILRGDSGFSDSKIYDVCDEAKTDFVIRLKSNNRLINLAKSISAQVMDETKVAEKQEVMDEFMYQADSWKKARRVVVKVTREAGEITVNHMFIVTSLVGMSVDEVIEFYGKRGAMENDIKECKNGFKMDKMSHSTFVANENKMMKHLLAYNIVNGFKRLVLPKAYRKMTLKTLRIKFFKVAARQVKKSRRIIFKLCSHYPYKQAFLETLQKIQNIKLE